jgi:Spy/CpxP family protein refolding chaperone
MNYICTLVIAIYLLSSPSTLNAQTVLQNHEAQQTINDGHLNERSGKESDHDRLRIDNLTITEEQRVKIKDLKTDHVKETIKLRDKIDELRDHLMVLSTANNTDMKEINATIDEITQTQNELMKSHENLKQQIRSLLNIEQRLQFDLNQSKESKHKRRIHHEKGE